jgi:sortase A
MASSNLGVRKLERSLLALGICLMTLTVGALFDECVGSRMALREFEEMRAAAPARSAGAAEPGGAEEADCRLFSATRVRAHLKNLLNPPGAPLAVLRIGNVNMRVPVFEGTDELTLNRGAGWIPGTARPGQAGNIGIAGHRDGFFRCLKDVAPGDTIELTTMERTDEYTVDQIEIVKPDDVGVLRPRGIRSLTLITCYPFYFIGSAPQRFVLQAAFQKQTDARGSKTVRPGEPEVIEK